MNKRFSQWLSTNNLIICLFLWLGTFIVTQAKTAEDWRFARPMPPKTRSDSKTVTLAPGYPSSSGGSHMYEYISSATIDTVNPADPSILRLSVSVFIVNPGGCTTGNYCATYDNSPEYVNAWIDWNGNKQWESNEQVMAKAGTGYTAIAYSGNMNFSQIISVPADAVSGTTYCRVMLGWGTNPISPTYSSWTWGDVTDLPVEISGEKPKIVSLHIAKKNGGSLFTYPMTSHDLAHVALLEVPDGYEVVNVAWNGDDIVAANKGIYSGPEFNFLGANKKSVYIMKYGPGTHGNKSVTATLIYKHIASGIIGKDEKTEMFKLFFPKDEDDDGDGIPNWFEYWKKDGACPSLANDIVKYDPALKSYQYGYTKPDILFIKGKIGIGPAAAIHKNSWSANGRTFCQGKYGIDACENTAAHELRHKWVENQWKMLGNWWGISDSDEGKQGKDYDDDLPDFLEMQLGTDWKNKVDTFNLESIKSACYKYYGDQEYYVSLYAEDMKGIAKKDWANPGKQTTPPYGPGESSSTRGASRYSAASGECNYSAHINDGQCRGEDLSNIIDFCEMAEVETVSAFREVKDDKTGKITSLEFDLKFDVKEAEYYSLTGWLMTEEEMVVAWASTDDDYDVGSHVVTLCFDAEIFEKAGVNGTLTLRLVEATTGTEDGKIVDLKENLFVTRAFATSDFIAYGVKQAGAGTDKFQGENLVISLPFLINSPGTFDVTAYLYDSSDRFLVSTEKQLTFETGRQTVDFSFPKRNLGLQKADGELSLKIVRFTCTDGGEEDTFVFSDVYKTQPVDAQSLLEGAIRFKPGVFSEQPLDSDNNGLYEGIMFGCQVANSEYVEKRVVVSGKLKIGEGAEGINVSREIILSPNDTQNLTLFFGGPVIYSSSTDGPYSLTNMMLFDTADGTILDSVPSALVTKAYSYQSFAAILFDPPNDFFDLVADTNGNGISDLLTVSFSMSILNTGTVNVEGFLNGPDGQSLGTATVQLTASSPSIVEGMLKLEPTQIIETQSDGPYTVTLLAYHSGFPDNIEKYDNVYMTDAYAWTDFEKGGNGEVDPIPDFGTATPWYPTYNFTCEQGHTAHEVWIYDGEELVTKMVVNSNEVTAADYLKAGCPGLESGKEYTFRVYEWKGAECVEEGKFTPEYNKPSSGTVEADVTENEEIYNLRVSIPTASKFMLTVYRGEEVCYPPTEFLFTDTDEEGNIITAKAVKMEFFESGEYTVEVLGSNLAGEADAPATCTVAIEDEPVVAQYASWPETGYTPAEGQTLLQAGNDVMVTFTWPNIIDAASYNLRIYDCYGHQVKAVNGIIDCHTTVKLSADIYFWVMEAVLTNGKVLTSPGCNFVVAMKNDAPIISRIEAVEGEPTKVLLVCDKASSNYKNVSYDIQFYTAAGGWKNYMEGNAIYVKFSDDDGDGVFTGVIDFKTPVGGAYLLIRPRINGKLITDKQTLFRLP